MGYQAVLITLATFAILLLIPPFIWHIKTLNIPAVTLIIWLLLMDIKILVDASIWGGSDFQTKSSGEGYCDVMIKLQVGANVGISSSVAGIMFNLYRILRADSVIPGLTSFRKIITDLAISLLTPMIVMGLNYLIQARRYYIFQYSGCQNISALSWVTIVIYTIWMVVWSLIGVIFAMLIIFTFFRKRKDVKDILKCTNSGLTLIRFSKLLIFCVVIILVMFPLSVYIFTDDISHIQPSYSFDEFHNKAVWGTILFVPLTKPYYISWIYMVLSYIVFIFFGLGSDAIEMYLSFLSRIGFGWVIEYFKRRQQQEKILKADKMVNSTLTGVSMSANHQGFSLSEGTAFDFEMQKMSTEEEDDDDKSPTTTVVSNVFGDNHEITRSGQSYGTKESELVDGLELDDDDIEYLKMLYEDDRRQEAKRAARASTDRALHGFTDLVAPSPTTTATSTELDYKYTVQYR